MKRKFYLLATALMLGLGAWAQSVPTADLLDVVFNEDGSAQDVSALANTVQTVGSPVVKKSPMLGIYEMCNAKTEWGQATANYYRVDYNDNIINAMKQGFTMETYVRNYWYDTMADSEAKPFSSHQGGGMGLMVGDTGEGNGGVQDWIFLPKTANVYRWAFSGVVPVIGQYQHIVGVWDKEAGMARIYVDGELKGEASAPGDLTLPSSDCRWFCIGADPDGSAKTNNAFQGDIAIARIYSKAMTDEEVAAEYQALQAMNTGEAEHTEEAAVVNPYLTLSMVGNSLTVEQLDDYEFHVITTGADPYVSMSSLQQTLTDEQVYVTFEYTCNQNASCEFFFSPITGGREMSFNLAATGDEYETAWVNIATQRESYSWGKRGDNLRFDVGTDAGIDLKIKNIRFATREEFKGESEEVTVTMQQDADGYYLITNPTQLREFSILVNNGNRTINGRLTADLDMTGVDNYPPIGWVMSDEMCSKGQAMTNAGFAGIFDGQGHTISNLSMPNNARWATNGVFGTVTGTVMNLAVDNFTFTGNIDGRYGAVAGEALQGGTIKNCYVINSTLSYPGGIVGAVVGANYGGVIQSCFDLNNTIENYSRAGHMIGDAADDNGIRMGTEINCYSDGTITGTYTSNKTNCEGNLGAASFESGEICFKLNSNGTAFYQTIGTDLYPTLDNTHKQVYAEGEFNCDGQAKAGSTITYSNNYTENKIPDHVYVDGKCVNCGAFEPDLMKQDEDGYYLLSTPTQLQQFATMVNSGKTSLNARMTKDIDLAEVDNFTPIGIYTDVTGGVQNSYKGTFDGQHHIIYNLKVDDTNDYEVGLFSRTYGATIQNLGIVNATMVSECSVRAGVLAGEAHISKVINCFTAGTLDVSTGHSECTGFCGEAASGTLTNCYTTHDMIVGGSCTLNSCYYGEEARNMATTGELCYKLNNGTFLDPIWYQTLETDAFPTQDSTHGLVYKLNDGSYADMHDDESFTSFRDDVVAAELDYCGDVVAQDSLCTAYEGKVNELAGIKSFSEFIDAYKELIVVKNEVETSAAAYKLYMDKVSYIKNYLNENPELGGTDRDKVETYVTDNVEPGDQFPNGSYEYIYANRQLNTEDVTAETEYADKLLSEAIKNGYIPGSEITNLLTNPDFSDGQNGWEVTTGTLKVVETGNETSPYQAYASTKLQMSQTLQGMQDGIYVVKANAQYRPFSDNKSANYGSYLYVNDNVNYLKVLRDEMVPLEEITDESVYENTNYAWIEDENGDIIGYGPSGVAGHAEFYGEGKYVDYAAARVTDGNLEVGISTPGFSGNNDTNCANFQLYYLGNAESDASKAMLNTVLADMRERAETILNVYTYVDDSYYYQYPNFSDALREELNAEIAKIDELAETGTGEQLYEIIESMSTTFKCIYECKNAYINMLDVCEDIYGNYNAFSTEGQEPTEEQTAVNNLYSEAWDGYYGTLSAQEAEDIADMASTYRWELYPTTATASNHINLEVVGPYEYKLTATGDDPYIGTNKLTEDLDPAKVILAYEYQDENEHAAEFFFSPFTAGHEIMFNVEPTNGWTQFYLDISEARDNWDWGFAGQCLRFDIIPGGDCEIYIRKMRLITREQMEAEQSGEGVLAPTVQKSVSFYGTYDLNGRRMADNQKLAKGVYVINGKKVSVK